MSSKDKSLSIIDSPTIATVHRPPIDRVKYNPYTGGIIRKDYQPTGSLSISVSAVADKVDVRSVRLQKKAGSLATVNLEFQIPYARVVVGNPAFELANLYLYLALDEGEFGETYFEDGIRTNMGDTKVTYTQIKIGSTTPSKGYTQSLVDTIVELLQMYTAYEIVALMTGVTPTTDLSTAQLQAIINENAQDLKIYAEAGYANSLFFEGNSQFLRKKAYCTFNFISKFEGDPEFSAFTTTLSNFRLSVNLNFKNIKKFKFELHAGLTDKFTLSASTKIKDIQIDAVSLYTINIEDVLSTQYNSLDALKTSAQIDTLIKNKPYIALKIASVITSKNNEINDVGKSFTSITPTSYMLVTSDTPAAPVNLFGTLNPYELNIINNSRTFYISYTESITRPPTYMNASYYPETVIGFLIKYTNTPGTASNLIRYYPFKSSKGVPMSNIAKLNNTYDAKTSYVTYNFGILDFFKTSAAGAPSYSVGMNFAPKIEVYAVSNNYQISKSPLNLSGKGITKLDLGNYAAQFFNSSLGETLGIAQLTFQPAAVKHSTPKIDFSFYIEYCIPKINIVGQGLSWLSNPKNYSPFQRVNSETYRVFFEDAPTSVISDSIAPVISLYRDTTKLSVIPLLGINPGNTYFYRLRLATPVTDTNYPVTLAGSANAGLGYFIVFAKTR